jgi:hypothetical protein
MIRFRFRPTTSFLWGYELTHCARFGRQAAHTTAHRERASDQRLKEELCDNKKSTHTLASGLFALILAACIARPALAQNTLGLGFNGLVSFDISDHYITPRGLNVEDKVLSFNRLPYCFGS